jgi:hypothetical protein
MLSISLVKRHLSTRSKDAGRITGRLQNIWIESNGMTEDIKVTSDVCLSNPYLTLVKDNFNYKEQIIETQPKVCELNRRIELLRKQTQA